MLRELQEHLFNHYQHITLASQAIVTVYIPVFNVFLNSDYMKLWCMLLWCYMYEQYILLSAFLFFVIYANLRLLCRSIIFIDCYFCLKSKMSKIR